MAAANEVNGDSHNVWPVGLCGCCSYTDPSTGSGKFFPVFCPGAMCCPFILNGRLETMISGEQPDCFFGMGSRGAMCCALEFCCPLTWCCIMKHRHNIKKKYNVKTTGCCAQIGQYICCPCSLFQAHAFMKEQKMKEQLNGAGQPIQQHISRN